MEGTIRNVVEELEKVKNSSHYTSVQLRNSDGIISEQYYSMIGIDGNILIISKC